MQYFFIKYISYFFGREIKSNRKDRDTTQSSSPMIRKYIKHLGLQYSIMIIV